MKKKSGFLIFMLIVIVIVSVIAIVLLPGQIFTFDSEKDWTQFLIYIPIITLVVSLSFLIANIMSISHQKRIGAMERRLGMWNTISYRVKKAGESAFNKLPIGIVVIDNDYKIMWSNDHARTIFMSPLQNINLKEVSLKIYEKMTSGTPNEEGNITFTEDIYGEIYQVEYLPKYDIIIFYS